MKAGIVEDKVLFDLVKYKKIADAKNLIKESLPYSGEDGVFSYTSTYDQHCVFNVNSEDAKDLLLDSIYTSDFELIGMVVDLLDNAKNKQQQLDKAYNTAVICCMNEVADFLKSKGAMTQEIRDPKVAPGASMFVGC